MSPATLAFLVVAVIVSEWPADAQITDPRRPYLGDLPTNFFVRWDGWANYTWAPVDSDCVPSCGYDRTIQTVYQCIATANNGDRLHVIDNWCIDDGQPMPVATERPCGAQLGDGDPCDCPTGVPTLQFSHFAPCVQPCGGKLERSAKCVRYDRRCRQDGVDLALSVCARIIDTEEDCGLDLVATCSTYSWVGGPNPTVENASCGPIKITRDIRCQILVFLKPGVNTFLVNDSECIIFGRLTRESKLDLQIDYDNYKCEYQPDEWSSCDTSCGAGQQTRTRKCFQLPRPRLEVPLDQCGYDPDIEPVPTTKNCNISCAYEPKEWSECSATCGSGTRTRDRRCVQIIDGVRIGVDYDECAKDPSITVLPQVETGTCRVRDCECEAPFYQTTDYGPCSATCEGTQTRTVTCWCVVEGMTRQENMSVCIEKTPSSPPDSTRSCGVAVCATYAYRVSPWGDCDSVCGPGQRRRVVQCIKTQSGVDTVVPLSVCTDNGLDPPQISVESCDSTCRYNLFPWRDCSVTCGGGVQARDVVCTRTTVVNAVETSTVVALAACADDPAAGSEPISERPCNTEECPCVDPSWQPSEWTPCSVTCGEGTRTRTLQCHCYKSGVDTAVADEECDGLDRPTETEGCGDTCPCVDPRWVSGEYGPCDKTCGLDAIRRRELQCRCRRGAVDSLEDIELCDNEIPEQKPPTVESCARECPCANDTIRYDYTRWRDCDKECDGTRTRKVQCRCQKNNVDVWVSSQICQDYLGKAPLTSDTCGPPCQSSWRIVTGWSSCSKSCGKGVRERRVVCQVFANGKLVSQASDEECTGTDTDEKPPETIECKGLPEDKSVWVSSPWSTCSNTCGVGVKHRQVRCVNKCSGEELADRRCKPRYKPVHKVGCNAIPCDRSKCVDQDKYYCDQIGRLGLCEDLKFHQHCCQTCIDVLLGKR